MVKITLISPCNTLVAHGTRIISSYLKKFEHKVDIIFLPNTKRFSDIYDKEVVNNLIQLCSSSDLIGFSIMTNYFLKTKELTLKLKEKLNIPIIWGGVHPTVKPEECLEYADIVCIGEGEEAMLELANNLQSGNITNIKNLWLKKDGKIIKNEVRHLEENIDKYPFQDYDLETHYILKNNKIIKITEQILEDTMGRGEGLGRLNVQFCLITTRNCPHNCTYCCNNAFRKIYTGKGNFVRKRTPENVIKEIELIKNKFNFIKQVLITDDTFFIRSKEEIEEFCKKYQERIRLPLSCFVSPLTLTEEKLKPLVDAGLAEISLGVQSFGYETLINIYKRPTPKSKILESIRILNKYKTRISNPIYHFIIDNPYETKESMKESLELIASLPKGSKILLFSLTFFPGTELYEKAKKDGIIKNEYDYVYSKKYLDINYITNFNYLTPLLFFARSQRIPQYLKKKIIKFLSKDEMIFLFDRKIFLLPIHFFMKIIQLRPYRKLQEKIKKFVQQKSIKNND